MHIPDGFINNGVSGPLLAGAAAMVGVAVVKVRRALVQKMPVAKQRLATFPQSNADFKTGAALTEKSKQKIWRLATVGAFIFAAQMVNFSIADGTSGHLLGGALAALILGPWQALLVMSMVLGIQALVFGDGGVLALGANVINMGIIAGIGSWYLYRGIQKLFGIKYFLIIAFCLAWFSVILAAAAASFELAASGTIALGRVLPAMLGTHALIGLGEGIITIGILGLLRNQRMPITALKQNNYE